jgi:hypothetical protein
LGSNCRRNVWIWLPGAIILIITFPFDQKFTSLQRKHRFLCTRIFYVVSDSRKKRPRFSALEIKCCSRYTKYRNEIGCFTNFNMYHSWWHSPFLRKKVIIIRKLSISRSPYLLKRHVSFLLITFVYREQHLISSAEKRGLFLVLFTTQVVQRHYDNKICIFNDICNRHTSF